MTETTTPEPEGLEPQPDGGDDFATDSPPPEEGETETADNTEDDETTEDETEDEEQPGVASE